MCGRTACALEPDTLCQACTYKDGTSRYKTLSWTKNKLQYKPSVNMGPRDVLPCIVNGSHFSSEEERVLCAMQWGLIPQWHKGDYKKHTLSTHNGRLETLATSKLYAPPLKNGKRCIVLCEGYYEWKAGQTPKSPKQPYYVYRTQNEGVRAEDPTTWTPKWSEDNGWEGFKLLRLAGLFNTYKTDEDETIYSCTMVTKDASDVSSWLHDRTPVFLLTDKDADAWLNEDMSETKAVKFLNKLTPSKGSLSWYPVSTLVNNVLHKSDECRKPIKEKEKEKEKGSASFMTAWLKQGTLMSKKRTSSKAGNENKEMDSKEDTKPSKINKLK